MKNMTRSGKALSNVVSTLIILVVSVLLAGVVTMYAINITSTRTQQEALKLTKEEIWVFGNGTAYAGVVVDNVGGRDVVIDKVQVRGVEADWTRAYYFRLPSALATSLNCPNVTIDWSNFAYTSGQTGNFTTDEFDKPLASGDTIIIYIRNPQSVSVSDIGVTIGITVFTGNAQYYVECNVKSAEFA
jgi:hypothetical protein